VKKSLFLTGLIAVAVCAAAEPARAQQFDRAIKNFSNAWTRNDEKTIANMIGREGASIDGPAGRLGPLSGRQAAAVLRHLFDDKITRDVRVRQTQSIGGDPEKAYAEIVWTTLAPETTQPTRVVIFVEFVREHEVWRVTKIRLLP
jgi:hypothetical protein